MIRPFYYVEKDGAWRSMPPEAWQAYVDAMVGHLKGTSPQPPNFEDYGKELLGKPSRVKVTVRPNGKKIYWSPQKHLQFRLPHDEWELADWEGELQAINKIVPKEKVQVAPDIFNIVLGQQ